MAEKTLYDMVLEQIKLNNISDEDLLNLFPNLYSIVKSPRDTVSKEKTFERSLGNPELRQEIQSFDSLKQVDFSKYKDEKPISSSFDDADMSEVEEWYAKAGKALDPTGKGTKFFSENPLYKLKPKMDLSNEDESYAAFEAFEDPEKSGDSVWFDSLLDAFGYPDTPEGWNQLSKDWNAVMSRKKWADQAKKYPTPLKFLFGRTFDVMEDGKKPSLGDVSVDAASNIAWAIPGANYINWMSKTPVLGNGVKAMSLARNAPGQTGTFLLQNSIVPAFNEIIDMYFGTDTEDEKRNGLAGRAENVGINSAINMFTPGLVKMLPTRAGGLFGGFGTDPTKFKQVNNTIADFVDYGNSQGAAQHNLDLMEENAKDALEVIQSWIKRYGDKAKTSASKTNLGEFKADLPGRLQTKGQAFIDAVDENGFDQGARVFFNPYRDEKRLAELKKLSQNPTSFMQDIAPYVSSYLVNRLGTNAVGDLIRSRLGRTTRYWKQDDEE